MDISPAQGSRHPGPSSRSARSRGILPDKLISARAFMAPLMMDISPAQAYRLQVDDKIAQLRSEAEALTGKDHHGQRQEKGKAVQNLRAELRYVDACRVARGLPPAHGHFAEGADNVDDAGKIIGAKEAEKLAAEAERALAELEGRPQRSPPPRLPAEGLPEDPDALLSSWRERVAELERGTADGLLSVDPEDVEELEAVAKNVVEYRERLVRISGYSKKDLACDPDLQPLEERLDALARVLLREAPVPAPDASTTGLEEELAELLQREEQLMARLVRCHKETAGVSPSDAREVGRILTDVAERKAALRVEGLSEREQERDEQVSELLLRLSGLRQKEHRDKKHELARRSSPELAAALQELEALRGGLEAHRRRLCDERGCSQRELRRDPGVCELEERLAALQKLAGA
mmetsp:Transcript_54304/g.154686  ORF Transcript_54304/g.154686 Transcript_54304/m.154686 type:complete len:408 (+) Transcript_54304:2-1225(+)